MNKFAIKRESILDLPIERQIEIAKEDGYSSHAEWVKHWEQLLAKLKAYSNSIEWGVRPEGWTEEDVERFQKKIDSTHGGK